MRRIRRPLVFRAPLPHRTLQLSLGVLQHNAEDCCFNKLGNRFFSGSSSHKRAGGKVTSAPEKVVSSQAQNSGSSRTPLGAGNVLQDEAKGSKPSEGSSSNQFLIVGACSVLVLGLYTFFPWDLIKSYYVGERKDPDILVEDLKETNSKGTELPSEETKEAEEKKSILKELEHPPVVQNHESADVVFEPPKAAHDGEEGHTQASSNGSADQDEADSVSIQKVSPADYVREKISNVMPEEHKTPEVGLKDEVSKPIGHLKEDLPKHGLLRPNLSDEFKANQSLTTTDRTVEVVPMSHKQKESLAKDVENDEDHFFMQKPSISATKRPSLLEAYYLGESSIKNMQENRQDIETKDDVGSHRHEGSDKVGNIKGEDMVNKLHIEGVQNVFDLLDVVHAAELRQAELDAQLYTEAQKRLKQALQQELKDAQAKELMYAEEASRLAKEIELEKEKAAAALELEQEMAREKLLEELRHKEEEANLKLKKAELLSKSEIAAAVAEEKLSYLKDVRDVKQELEALYMVLSTQSKEFHQSHTIHKLAVGTFALEEAMKRGAPVEKEVSLIRSSYRDTGLDPLLDAVISSLPQQAVKKGTLTPSQLQQKFERLKNGVLELSLIPSTGGGFITHAAAKLVSALKVKESGHYSDGVAAVVSQVQRCLADGKLADAAELLEKGVRGTEAEVLVADWVQNARERAIMEQMLLLLQAHATAAASSLA